VEDVEILREGSDTGLNIFVLFSRMIRSACLDDSGGRECASPCCCQHLELIHCVVEREGSPLLGFGISFEVFEGLFAVYLFNSDLLK